MMRTLLIVLFFSSVFFLPWWFVLVFGVILLAYTQDYVPVLLGGVLFDIVHSAPIVALFNITYLYTIVFALLIIVSMLLRKQLLD